MLAVKYEKDRCAHQARKHTEAAVGGDGLGGCGGGGSSGVFWVRHLDIFRIFILSAHMN